MKVNAKVACFSSVLPAFGPGDGIEITLPTEGTPPRAHVERELAGWIATDAIVVVNEKELPPAVAELAKKTKAELKAERAESRADARQEEAEERAAEDRAASKKK